MKKDAMASPPRRNDLLISRVNFSSGFSMILDDNELLRIEKQNRRHIFGCAVDLGTMSVCMSLCNVESGEELSSATVPNRQSEFGQNLISRARFAARSEKNRKAIKEGTLFSMNKAIEECVRKSGVDRQRIYTAVIVGNPFMHNFLFGIPLHDNKNDGRGNVSFVLHKTKARMLDFSINPDANVRFLPGINRIIGSDVLATIFSLRFHASKTIKLCVDVGAHVKVILGSAAGVVVASSASSAVFEEGILKCGMVAGAGAIEWIRIEKGKIKLLTIGHIRPRGLCGSGIIDAVSELRRVGIIDSRGQMKKHSFLIYKDKKVRIELTQQDVNNINASTAAVRLAIGRLMKRLKVIPARISNVFLAGALGDYVNAENIIRTGLLPEVLKNKISFVGNTAFCGAKRALLSRKVLKTIISLRGKVKHVPFSRKGNIH